jgi:hypothetical protein
LVAASCLDNINDTVERSIADAAAGFRNRHNDCQILNAGLFFCPEAQFSEDDRLSQRNGGKKNARKMGPFTCRFIP